MHKMEKKIINGDIKRSTKLLIKTIVESSIYNIYYKKPIPKKKIKSIVFICSGNICRSVFAEYYFKSISKRFDLLIQSCGTDVVLGKEGNIPQETINTAKEFGVEIVDHQSKDISRCRYDSDLIVALEFKHYKSWKNIFPELDKNLFLMTDFLNWPNRLFCNIYDPFGLDETQYKKTFLKIEKCLINLLLKLKIDC
ncbi:hypothetical protein [Desulfosarcina ovata]|uniref:protein-tyrosine-phosphatase n=1 Tax=Desulfosarcina ovata subsp. ovata TaxID=2752305 RepID=A0A5K8A7C7_9BACT|nr:hypothetical protein [Desulfosarcina ovata]BBO88533.1 hypothetical protein DSCOOX_17130 [Desulfosarcina ovata subsp. ovata]